MRDPFTNQANHKNTLSTLSCVKINVVLIHAMKAYDGKEIRSVYF